MSEQLLNNILEEAIQVMSTNLRDELDLQETVATFSPNIIYEAIYGQLRFTHIKNIKDKKGNTKQNRTAKYEAWKALNPSQKEQIKGIIKSKATDIMSDLMTEYKNINQQGVRVEVKGTPQRFTVTTFVTDPGNLQRKTGYKGITYEVGSFRTVQQGYKTLLQDIWRTIADMVQEISGVEDSKLASNTSFSDLEHVMGKSVAERQRSKGITQLYNQVKQKVKSDAAAKEVFEQLGISTYLQYVSTDERTVVEVHVGPASKNRRQSRKERLALDMATSAIQDSLKRYAVNKNVTAFAGSDNRVEIEKKKIVETFNKSVALKTKSIDTKRKLSKKKTKTKKTTLKKKNVAAKVKTIAATKQEKIIRPRTRTGTSSAQSNVTLAALINRALPATVAKNMNLPALKYRTGRFANSVRVTDVVQTPQGFPSIGYTYRKYPYQTFEPGYAQGSADRDPRKLIDKSIREVAAELLIGRFYTRRV